MREAFGLPPSRTLGMKIPSLRCVLLAAVLLIVSCEGQKIRLALISGTSAFFEPVQAGWETSCASLSSELECQYIVPEKFEYCVDEMRQLIVNKLVDGLATQCGFTDLSIYQEAYDAGIPVVAFDAPPPDDLPSHYIVSYVGTDQYFMGGTLGRLLRQLVPEGGTYAMMHSPGTPLQDLRIQGFVDEVTRDNDREDRAHWYGIEPNFDLNPQEPIRDMEYFAMMNPTAIVAFYQTPMRNDNWTTFVDRNRWRNITLVGTDGSDYQLSYLQRGYVNGLVGQMPYDMGVQSARVLFNILALDRPVDRTVGTNLVAYNLIPLVLPELVVDQNLLGNFKFTGIVCFSIIGIACVGGTIWTWIHKDVLVVKAAQPFFLVLIAGGILVLGSAILPLSYDDEGMPESMSRTKSVAICMSIPWLGFTGFTATMSALFSKTWRVNKFFHSSSAFGRIKVSVRDVLAPFAVLMLCNIVVLTCWTIIDPLTYERNFELGTDYWNREISSIGTCTSEHAAAYLVPLAVINFSVIVIAGYQAFQARDIKSEFAESRYIAFAMFSMFQAFLTGFPIIAVVRDIPQAFYLVTTFLIFTLCMVIMGLIYIPKIVLHRRYAAMSEADQRRMISLSVKRSAAVDALARRRSTIMGLQDYPPSEPQSFDQAKMARRFLGVSSTEAGAMVSAPMRLQAALADLDLSESTGDPGGDGLATNSKQSKIPPEESAINNKKTREIEDTSQGELSSISVDDNPSISSFEESFNGSGEQLSPPRTGTGDDNLNVTMNSDKLSSVGVGSPTGIHGLGWLGSLSAATNVEDRELPSTDDAVRIRSSASVDDETNALASSDDDSAEVHA